MQSQESNAISIFLYLPLVDFETKFSLINSLIVVGVVVATVLCSFYTSRYQLPSASQLKRLQMLCLSMFYKLETLSLSSDFCCRLFSNFIDCLI